MLKIVKIWSIAILDATDSKSIFTLNKHKTVKIFASKRFSYKFPSIICKADPFFYVDEKRLYLFYEQVARGDKGRIYMVSSVDMKNWTKPYEVLREKFHLSFPFVFSENGNHYMLPETMSDNSIRLYRSKNFPNNWTLHKILLTGEKFVDTSIIKEGNYYYLFTTVVSIEKNIVKYKLKLFNANSLDTEWKEHPSSPISESLKSARNGGSLFRYKKNIYRPAQNCEESYGNNISIYKILQLSPLLYKEQINHENIFDKSNDFFKEGGHHFNTIQFDGSTIVAVDGLKKENPINALFQQLYLKCKRLLLMITLMDTARDRP